MDDQVLGLLRFGMLGLLYLFFGRAVWAVWSEVRAASSTPGAPAATVTRTTTTGTPARARAHALTVVEPAELRRQLTWTGDAFVVGRAGDCDWSLPHDAFLSQRHLAFQRDASGLWVEDLGSTNGTQIDGRRLTGRQALFAGARIHAGTLVVEAR